MIITPTTLDPMGQVYVALPPNSRPDKVTVPSSGCGNSGHSRSKFINV